MTQIRWKYLTVPKLGNPSSENEDAFFTYKLGPLTLLDSPFTCAMADGATTATFSKLWASMVVKTFGRSVPAHDQFMGSLEKCQAEWKKHFQKMDLPWHTEEKIKMGSFATLLWLAIFPHEPFQKAGGMFSSICLGDTCIFQLRKHKVIFCKPIEKSADFNNRPVLLPSLSTLNHSLKMDAHINLFSADWQKGDHLLLATDALAAFLIRKKEEDPDFISGFSDMVSTTWFDSKIFSIWVDHHRTERTLRNDDTSLVSMTIL